MPPPATQSPRFEGKIYLDDKPVPGGYRVIFRNVSEGKVLEGTVTSADGAYSAEVVLGQRYVVERVVGPGGRAFTPPAHSARPVLTQGPVIWDIRVASGGK
jgi:hypothetical protein